MLVQHEHLLRRNIGYWHAYGHLWRDEQAAHEQEVNEGYRASMLSEREEFERADYRQRVREMNNAR